VTAGEAATAAPAAGMLRHGIAASRQRQAGQQQGKRAKLRSIFHNVTTTTAPMD
jgi:hypothetical protein